MSQTDKGVLIFDEWFEAMDHLGASDFKKLMIAIYRYQIFGEKPPEFKGKSALAASVIFPYITRRRALAKSGKLAAEKRYGQFSGNPILDDLLSKRGLNK